MKTTKPDPWHFRDHSTEVDIPPLGMVIFRYNIQAKTESASKLKIKK